VLQTESVLHWSTRLQVNTTRRSELKIQVVLGENGCCQFKLKRGISAGRKFGEKFGEKFGGKFIFGQN
jgi:hypothetical protein